MKLPEDAAYSREAVRLAAADLQIHEPNVLTEVFLDIQ